MKFLKFFNCIKISAAILLFVFITAGCGNNLPISDSSEEVITGEPASETAETSISETTSAENIDWRQIYLEYLSEAAEAEDYGPGEFFLNENIYDGLALIYVNDDEIPELVLHGPYEVAFSMIISIASDGSIDELQTEKPHFYYVEKENIIDNSAGYAGWYWDIFYYIDANGKWALLAEGYYGDESGFADFDNFTYSWDGEYISEEEYDELCDSYLNPDTKVFSLNIDYMDLSSMRNYLAAGSEN